MMAGLFAVLAFAIAAILWRKREMAMAIVLVGVLLCWLILCYHATDTLKINW